MRKTRCDRKEGFTKDRKHRDMSEGKDGEWTKRTRDGAAYRMMWMRQKERKNTREEGERWKDRRRETEEESTDWGGKKCRNKEAEKIKIKILLVWLWRLLLDTKWFARIVIWFDKQWWRSQNSLTNKVMKVFSQQKWVKALGVSQPSERYSFDPQLWYRAKDKVWY